MRSSQSVFHVTLSTATSRTVKQPPQLRPSAANSQVAPLIPATLEVFLARTLSNNSRIALRSSRHSSSLRSFCQPRAQFFQRIAIPRSRSAQGDASRCADLFERHATPNAHDYGFALLVWQFTQRFLQNQRRLRVSIARNKPAF